MKECPNLFFFTFFFFKMYLLMKAKIHGERREGKEQGCRYEIDKKEIWRRNKQTVDENEEFLGSTSKP